MTPKGGVFWQGTVQTLADRYVVFRDEYGAVSRLLLELIDSDSRDEYTGKLITPALVERATCAPPPC